MDNHLFWDIVDTEIKKQNTTYDWVSHKTKISKGTFSSWKSRQNLPCVDSAYKIAQALNVSVEYLLTGVEFSDNVSNEVVSTICQMLACFDENDLLAVKNLVITMNQRYLKSSVEKVSVPFIG